MNYQETIDWLFAQFPAYHIQGVSAYKPGLENVTELAELFGNPHRKLRFIHVAGTNGKGSVSNMLASVMMESGEKTGLFTSPHIFDFTERIRINGEQINEGYVVDFCKKVRSFDLPVKPSFFEITWLMALCYFRDEGCTMVVAETGLGGRLDATNIVEPELSVITNIGLDHTNILGTTRKAIAFEKAGIIKRETPVVLGQFDPEILTVFEERASEENAEIVLASPPLSFPATIHGYQQENYATVATAVETLNRKGFSITTAQLGQGMEHLRQNTGFFGRMEVIGDKPKIILDCAHNADGIRKLLEHVNGSRLRIVYGTSSDKDMTAIAALLPRNADYFFTVFSNPRSADIAQLRQHFGNTGKTRDFFENSLEALAAAKNSANEEDTILIFGSFFLAHDFFDFFSPKRLSK